MPMIFLLIDSLIIKKSTLDRASVARMGYLFNLPIDPGLLRIARSPPSSHVQVDQALWPAANVASATTPTHAVSHGFRTQTEPRRAGDQAGLPLLSRQVESAARSTYSEHAYPTGVHGEQRTRGS